MFLFITKIALYINSTLLWTTKMWTIEVSTSKKHYLYIVIDFKEIMEELL